MKKGFFSRRSLLAVTALLLSGILFNACKKDSDRNVDIPVAGLMAFNLAPDQQAVGIALNGNLLTNAPLAYTNYSGGYRNIYPGQRSIQAYDYIRDTTLVNAAFNFDSKKYYSLFVIGSKGSYKNVIVMDDIDSLPATHAYVRYINAIPDSSTPTVSIKAGATTVLNNQAPFSSISGFSPVSAGIITVDVKNGASISTTRTIAVENAKIYTLLLLGVPGSADTLKAVQIKYILNGTITDDSKQ